MDTPAGFKSLDSLDLTKDEKDLLKEKLKREILEQFTLGDIASMYIEAYYPEEYRKAIADTEDNTLHIRVTYGSNSGLPEKD